MQVLAEARYGIYSSIGELAAFGEDEISETRGGADDPLHRGIGDEHTIGQVQDAQVLQRLVGWEV